MPTFPEARRWRPHLGLRGRILLGQVGVLLLVLAAIDAFTLITLERTYLQERRIHYLTQANMAASIGGTYLARKEPYLRYVAREFGGQAGARVLFLDATGTVVVDSYGDPAVEGKRLPAPEVAEALAGKQGSATHRFSDLGWVMYTAVPVTHPAGEGAVFLSASLAPVEESLRALAWRMAILSATALAAGIAASFLLARVITRPLSRLRRAAGELAAGRWGHRVAMHGHDEIARLGQAFDRMAEDLQQLDRTRRDFVADASHELRTPLAAMRALAEPMAHGQPLPADTYRELAKDLLAQVKRLQRLSEGLLELARLENQLETGAPLHRIPTDLTKVAREAVDQIVPVAEQRSIQIILDLPPRLPATVDPEAIVRVLTNLLHNAVKYTPTGGQVSLSMRGHGDRVKLQVSDTGEGIPPDQIPLLFQRFHRVDRARARHTGGTGLGLAIADRLMRLHGGEITVESTPGQGSTFTVWIPYS